MNSGCCHFTILLPFVCQSDLLLLSDTLVAIHLLQRACQDSASSHSEKTHGADILAKQEIKREVVTDLVPSPKGSPSLHVCSMCPLSTHIHYNLHVRPHVIP